MNHPKLSFFCLIALLLSFAGFFAAHQVNQSVYESLPHLEDEMTYIWQARLASSGKLVTESPPCPGCFVVPFVIDQNGIRFGKYPPAWPALLSIGVRMKVHTLVNPLLASLSVWLTFLLAKRLTNPWVGILSQILLIVSPIFLINSGSLLAHPFGLFLALGFSLAWLDLTSPNSKLPVWVHTLTAGFCLGLLMLTRPLTAIGVALPFFIHGIILLVTSKIYRLRILLVGLLAALIGSLFFIWQYAVTGNPFQDTYQLWWAYDRIGFGPGIGLQIGGYTPSYGITNARFSLGILWMDLFGWWKISWVFLPFGIWALRKNRNIFTILGIFPSLVITYMLYWVASAMYGSRYYYEGLPSLVICSAAGIYWLVTQKIPFPQNRNAPPLLTNLVRVFILATLVLGLVVNIKYYLPARLNMFRGLNEISQSSLELFSDPTFEPYLPALVIVFTRHRWVEYAPYLELESPTLDSPWIFSLSAGKQVDDTLAKLYPDRTIFHYNLNSPEQLMLIREKAE